MTRVSSGVAMKIIAISIFMAATGLPLYSQEVMTSERERAPQSTNEDFQQGDKESNSLLVDSQASAQQPTTKGYTFPTKRERFNRYVNSTVGPFSLARTAISAGIDQWRDNPEEWEQGASGYGKRYASGFGRNAIQQTVTYGLDSALELDTGFRRSTQKGFFPRLKHALAENITSRTRTGKRVISVPRLSGAYASGIIAAETWYPPRYNYKDGLRMGTTSLLTGFGINLIREFLIRW